jgi:hypothetical protein
MDNHDLNKLILFKHINLTSSHGTSEQLFHTNTAITVTQKMSHNTSAFLAEPLFPLPQIHNYTETLYLPNTMSDFGTSSCCTQYATPTY